MFLPNDVSIFHIRAYDNSSIRIVLPTFGSVLSPTNIQAMLLVLP